jgi:hypothetical protein
MLKDRTFNGTPNPGDKTTAEGLILSMISHAVKDGSPALYQMIFDRNDGPLPPPKPPTEVDVDTAAANLDQFAPEDQPTPKGVSE